MSRLPVSSTNTVAARPWQWGARVTLGPTYRPSGFSDQIDHTTAVRSIIIRPDQLTLKEWAESCLVIRGYQGSSFFGGWSPGRSVEVMVFFQVGMLVTTDTFFYKLFDFGCCDIDLVPNIPVPHSTPAHFMPVWEDFIRISIRLVLVDMYRLPQQMDPSTMVLDMIRREIGIWNLGLVRMVVYVLSGQNDMPGGPRVYLERYSVNIFWARLRRLAALPDPRVLQVWPDMFLYTMRR